MHISHKNGIKWAVFLLNNFKGKSNSVLLNDLQNVTFVSFSEIKTYILYFNREIKLKNQSILLGASNKTYLVFPSISMLKMYF